MGENLGASPEVEEWEIAVLHRAHRTPLGAGVRATWIEIDPARIERAIDVYKLVALPTMAELEGFCSASLFVDRASGRAVSSVTYDSRESLDRAGDKAAQIRTKGAEKADAEVLEVREFDLALAHLHVPELA